MAQIAEDLLLLLLDNAANRPALDRDRREKVLGAAVLLDLAWACRIRPSVDGEPIPPGRLLLLAGPALGDPILDPALWLLQRRPLKPSAAVAKLRRGIEPALLRHLEEGGHIRPIQLRGNRFNGSRVWPIANRSRVNEARSALLAALVRSPESVADDRGDHLAPAPGRRVGHAAEPQRAQPGMGQLSSGRHRRR
jgi:hypothetical protein